MDIGLIEFEDWIEFEDKYLSAYNWLLDKSLEREYNHLKNNKTNRNEWAEKRYQELKKLMEKE